MAGMKLMGLLAVLMAVPGQAQQQPVADPWAGDYVMSQMELVAQLRLNPDGTFLYGLTVGSLDERGQGSWRVEGGRVILTSDPRPKAPEVAPGPVTDGGTGPFAIRVTTPKGRELVGIDFRIDFTDGGSMTGSSNAGPWTLDAEEQARIPRAITFEMQQYRLNSGPFPLDPKPGRTATFILTANDFGVADLTGSYAVREGGKLVLQRPEGKMEFRRIEREPAPKD